MAAQPPNEVLDIFEREQSTLATFGQPDGVLPVGSTLPDVELIGPDGVPTTLGEAAGGRPAAVVFYRGAWCPYCNITLSNYQTLLLPALSDRAVRLIAVSPQRPDGSMTMQQKHDLAFAVLSDPGNVLARPDGDRHGAFARGTRGATQIGTGPDSDQRGRHDRTPLAHHCHPRRWSDSAMDRRPSGLLHPHRGARHHHSARRTELVKTIHLSNDEREASMTVRFGLLALLEAQPGKGDDLRSFLEEGRTIAAAEIGTVTWYAFKITDTSYGIFDTFETEEARQAHLDGQIPAALGRVAADLLAGTPEIRMIEVIALT